MFRFLFLMVLCSACFEGLSKKKSLKNPQQRALSKKARPAAASSPSLDREPFFKLSPLEVYIENHFYTSPPAFPKQASSYTNVVTDFQIEKSHRYWFYDAKLKAQASLDRSKEHYASIPSLNIGFQLKNVQLISKLDLISVSIGRYKKIWSWMDHDWQMGLFNPQNLYDRFRAEDLGIIGSALTLKGRYWSWTSLAGGVFLPNKEPPIDRRSEEGAFQSTSRWHVPPRSRVKLFNKTIDSYYWLKEPYRKNVLFQSSYLTQIFFGDRQEKWVSAVYAYKPLNQVHFRVRGGLSIEDASMQNEIHYHSLKHHLSLVEVGLKLGAWKIEFSVMDERVGKVNLPSNWLTPPVHSAIFTSIAASRKINLTPFSQNEVRASYLTSFFRSIEGHPLLGGDIESTIALDRFKLKEGFSVQWRSSLFQKKKKKLLSFLTYWYSLDQKGGWLKWRVDYLFNSKIGMHLELNIIGADDDKNHWAGFFAKYLNNDRLSIGGRYAF